MISILTMVLLFLTFGVVELADITYTNVDEFTTYIGTSETSLYDFFNCEGEIAFGCLDSDYNLIGNSDFHDASVWTGITGLFSIVDEELHIVGDGVVVSDRMYQKISATTDNILYIQWDIETSSYTQGQILFQIADYNDSVSLSNNYYSSVFPFTTYNDFLLSVNNGVQINIYARTTPLLTSNIDNVMVFDLTVIDEEIDSIGGVTLSTIEDDIDDYRDIYNLAITTDQHAYTYTINELDISDLILILVSSVFWVFTIKLFRGLL